MARVTQVFCLLAMICWTAVSSPAQGIRIGEHGARVVLGSAWKKQTIDPDFGENQFVVMQKGGLFSQPKQAFAIVMEIESVLESPEDFRRMLEAMVQFGYDAETEIRQEEQYTRATRRFDAEINGLDFAYRLELLTNAGLTYYIMAWSLKGQGGFLDRKVEEFLGGFRFPDRSSAWHRQTQPVERTFSIEGFDLSFSIRPFVLREKPREGDLLFQLESPDGEHGVYAFEMEGFSLDEMLEASAEACAEGSKEFVEVSRRDLRVSGIDGRLLVAADETHTFYLMALPLDRDRVLDLRYASYGPPETRREDRDLLLRTLKLNRSATVISLPEPVAEATPLGQNSRAVFDSSTLLGDTTLLYARTVQRIADETWLALEWDSAVLVTADQPADGLVKLDDGNLSSMARWRNQWLITNEEEEVREVRDGTVLSPQPFAARILASVGDDLLLARSVESHDLVGLTSSSQMGADVLIRRTPGGLETEIAKLPHLKVSMIVTNVAGTTALLLAGRRPEPRTLPYREGATCLEVDLRGGSVREFGDWQSVEAIARSDRGWLVTGRPRGLPRGIYDCRRGVVSPLVTGERVMGVELADGRLVFASDLRSAAPQPFLMYGVAIADIAESGPRVLPFSTQHLNQIGRRITAAASGSPRTEVELRRVLDGANRAARELVGAELPLSGAGIDALVAEVYATRGELEPAGRVLLAILVTAVNLDQGAVWVAGGSGGWSDWVVHDTEVEATGFAVAHTPANLLTSVLDDGEGSWNPGTSVLEGARGRHVLFGLDPNALKLRVQGSEPAGLASALDSKRARDIRAILEAIPENVFFREQVYEHLVVRGQTRIVEEVAGTFAKRPDAELADLRAWFAAWGERVDDPRGAEALARATLDAVREHPTDPSLYFLLGSAYEKAKPEEPAYARTCHQRVLRIQQWGPLGEAAQEALDRLSN